MSEGKATLALWLVSSLGLLALGAKAGILPESRYPVWVVLSLGLYALGTSVAWHFRLPRSGRLGQLARQMAGWHYAGSVRRVLRFGYYVLIPYFALLAGVASPHHLGLLDLDWPRSLGLALLTALASMAAFALLWKKYFLALGRLDADYLRGLTPLDAVGLSTDTTSLVLDALYLEVHWALYRGLAIAYLGYYGGSALALAIIAMEWLLSPGVRRALGIPGKAELSLFHLATAPVTTALFFGTRNLWATIPVHLALKATMSLVVLGRLAPRSKKAAAPAPAPAKEQ
ncbi:MAG: hypothetical protein AB1566_13725 [Chloroflexota bacterium]